MSCWLLWTSLVIFLSFDNFSLILELATQFTFKVRSKSENFWQNNNFPTGRWNQNVGILKQCSFKNSKCLCGVIWTQPLPFIFARSSIIDFWQGTTYAFIRNYLLPIRCTCESKLCACSLALKRSIEMHSRTFERLFDNKPLNTPLSIFAPVLDKSKETVMRAISL